MSYIKPLGISGVNSTHALYSDVEAFLEFGQLNRDLMADTALTTTATTLTDPDIGECRVFTSDANAVTETMAVAGNGQTVVIVHKVVAPYNTGTSDCAFIEFNASGHRFDVDLYNGSRYDLNFRGASGAYLSHDTSNVASQAELDGYRCLAIAVDELVGIRTAINGTLNDSTTDITSAFTQTVNAEIMKTVGDGTEIRLGAVILLGRALNDTELQSVSTDPWALAEVANVAPVADNATFSINDQVSNGHIVGTYVATDSDGTIASYSITGTQLAIDNAGQITVLDNSGLTAGTPIVETVTATDNDGDTDTATITVNVTAPELELSNISTLTPVAGGQITFDYTNEQGILTAGDYTVSAQGGGSATIDIFDPAVMVLDGDIYPETPYQADTVIPVTDGVTTVNITIQIQIEAGESLGVITEVDPDGAYANDVGIAAGHTVHVVNSSNIVFDIATGLGTSDSNGGSLEYAVYDGEWSDYVLYEIPAYPADQVSIDDLVITRNSATVTFSYPGTDITSFEYNIGGGWLSATSPQAILGLIEDTSYTLQIRPLLNSAPGAVVSTDFNTEAGTDLTPSAFSGQTQIGVELDSVVTFSPVLVLGVDAGYDIATTVTDGEIRVSSDGGATWSAWSTDAQNVRLNYQVEVRHTASSEYSTSTTAVLSIGGVTGNFTSMTVADSIAPTIYPNVSSPYEVELGSVWTDPGATVTDNADASRQITADQLVDTSVLGSTVIDYNATDVAGNAAQTVQLTVNVVDSGAAQAYTFANDSYSLVVDAQGNPENVTFDVLEVWTAAPEENGSVVTRFNNLEVYNGRFSLSSSLVQQGVTYLLIGRDNGNLPANYMRTEGQFQ